jgi:hypothetical protein
MIIGSILLLIAIAEFGLGIWFITKYPKNQTTLWYGLFALGVSFYVGSNAFGFLEIGDMNYAEKVGWSGAAIITASFLAFSYSFPLPRKKNPELIPLVLWPIIVFVPTFLFTTLLIGFSSNELYNYETGYQTVDGPYFWVFLIFFGVYWLWSLKNLISNYLNSDGIHRWQLRMLLTGVSLSLLVSVVFDIILPLIARTNFGYVGSLFSAIWLGFTASIILKK